ncbi:MAG: hypothetical protein VCB42_06405 [Myxococcota bacterium]
MHYATRQLPWIAAVLLLASSQSVAAQTLGCTYNRSVYPEGTEMCQGEDKVRCTSGAWGSIGLCDEKPLPGAPVAEGPDVDTEARSDLED